MNLSAELLNLNGLQIFKPNGEPLLASDVFLQQLFNVRPRVVSDTVVIASIATKIENDPENVTVSPNEQKIFNEVLARCGLAVKNALEIE